MPNPDTTLILSAIESMHNERREDLVRVHDRIDALAIECSRLQQHEATMTDHESRIRINEQYRYRQAGQVALVGAGGGAFSVVCLAIGRFILERWTKGG